MAKIRIATRQGQTFDAEWPDGGFDFQVFTANVRALQAIALPGIFIPYAELQYVVMLNNENGQPLVHMTGMTKQ